MTRLFVVFRPGKFAQKIAGGLLVGLQVTLPIGAQEITAFSPTTAIANVETRFVAEGMKLPTENSAKTGLKLTTSPPGVCVNAKRYQEATSRRYYFSCEFKPSATPVIVYIHNKHKGKSEQLWRQPVEVWSASPEITSITVSGNLPASEARVRCDGASPCLTIAGNLTQSEQLSFLVSGKNLPRELHLDAENCMVQILASAEKSSESRELICRPQPGTLVRKVRILSGPPAQNASVLWSADLGTVAVPQ